MFSLLRKWNTLRNQILFVFLSVMLVVLLFVSILIFNQVSTLLEKMQKNKFSKLQWKQVEELKPCMSN